MQAIRPRALVVPLQIGLGIQVHRQIGSRFLVDTLHKLGFCSSYSEIQKFERSAAFHQGTEISGTHLAIHFTDATKSYLSLLY